MNGTSGMRPKMAQASLAPRPMSVRVSRSIHMRTTASGCRKQTRSSRSFFICPNLPPHLQLGQLRERRGNPGLLPAEVDDNGDVALDAYHPAEAIAVMRHLSGHGIGLDRRGGLCIVERASRQVAPRHGAGCAHDLKYA